MESKGRESMSEDLQLMGPRRRSPQEPWLLSPSALAAAGKRTYCLGGPPGWSWVGVKVSAEES